jgi:alpha-beta hydrolase superfamily lysophospholipase
MPTESSAPETVRFPVTLADPTRTTVEIVARLARPTGAAPARPIWLFCLPGAGEDWRYWMHSHLGESFSEFATALGYGVIAIDHLGTGESRYPGDAADLTFEMLAGAYDEIVRTVRERYTGSDGIVVAIGHSAGGGVAIAQQGLLGSFDLVIDQGIPVGPFGGYSDPDEVRILPSENGLVRLNFGPADEAQWFMPDVPAHVVDHVGGALLPFLPAFLSLMSPGTLSGFAARIECPVLEVFGEVDLAADPLAEAAYYLSAADVTIHVERGVAHSHNNSPARHRLWGAVANWIWSRTR